MKLFITMTLAALMLLAGVALAADIDGKWVSSMPGRNGGPAREITYTLKASGDKLTGTVSSPMGGNDTEIQEGTIKGDEVSFVVVREFNGNTMKMKYAGKVSGDELKLTQTMEGSDRPPREVVAKRAK